MKVAIIRTGVANLASVRAAFQRLQIDARIAETPAQVEPTDAVVLPGVGAFGAGIQALSDRGWIDVIRERFENDSPTLAICLGMQMLCEFSDEASDVQGISVFKGTVRKFPDEVRIPQFGWNQVFSTTADWPGGYVYFANSYCLPNAETIRENGWQILTANHGIEFVAAARKGKWLACQFHPELSGNYGLNLIRSWLARFTTLESQPHLRGATKC